MDNFNLRDYLAEGRLLEDEEDYYIHNESDEFEKVYTVKNRGRKKMAKSFPSYKEAVDYLNTLKESINTTNIKSDPPYKLETGNVYLLPNGQILTITSGIDQGERLTYTIFTPKTGETAEEWNHYKKMVSNPGKWKILHEPSNESVNESSLELDKHIK